MFKDIWNSMWNFKYYKNFLNYKGIKAFLHLIIVSFFIWLAVTALSLVQFFNTTGGASNIIDNYIPDFVLTGGELSCEGTIKYDDKDAGVYIDIDTSVDGANMYDTDTKALLRNYSNALIIGSKSMLVKGNGLTQQLNFSSLGSVTYTKNDFKKLIPVFYLLTLVGYGIVLLYDIAGYIILAAIATAFASIIAMTMRLKLRYKQVFIVSVYAATLPIMLVELIETFVVGIPFSSVFTILLILLYVVMALRAISASGEYTITDEDILKAKKELEGAMQKRDEAFKQMQGDAVAAENQAKPTANTDVNSETSGDIKPSDGWSFGSGDGLGSGR